MPESVNDLSNRELQDWLLDFAEKLHVMGFARGTVVLVKEAAMRLSTEFEFPKL
jgi:hypothetical protein